MIGGIIVMLLSIIGWKIIDIAEYLKEISEELKKDRVQ